MLIRYPDMIEEGLTLKGRQVAIGWLRGDLLFTDKHGQRLIVELKKGAILSDHLAQLMDYEGYLLQQDDPSIRTMLIGNRVPQNMRNVLAHHGFEWREFTISYLRQFLTESGDTEYLNYFGEESDDLSQPKPNAPAELKSRSNVGKTTIVEMMYALFATNQYDEVLSSRNIIDLVLAAFPGTNRNSVFPSDYCYNITNKGIKFEHHLFEYLGQNQYKVLGKNFPYTGAICWKKQKVGEWKPGAAGPTLYEHIYNE